MRADETRSTQRAWQIPMPIPGGGNATPQLQTPERTRLPDGQSHAPSHGQRTDAADSIVGARQGEIPEQNGLEDARLAGAILEEVIRPLMEPGTPDEAVQATLMDAAQRLAAQVPAREINSSELQRQADRESESPLSADQRAWLLSCEPLKDTLSDLVQRLCIAKAHLAIDPLFARQLAASVHSATNFRGQFGATNQIITGLGRVAMQIDISDGVAAQSARRKA